MRLDGKVAVITGGTAGIGLATAARFLEEGAKVVISGRDEIRGQESLKTLGGRDRAIFVQGNVSQADDAKRMIATAVETFGRLDILVNNAGIYNYRGTVVDLSEEAWDRTIDINLKGTFLCCKYAIPEMLQNDGGSIVNLSSTAGLIANRQACAYCSAKAGIAMLTKSIALDFASQGIRANCVAPGAVPTETLQQMFADGNDPHGGKDVYKTRYPMGTMGTPEDIANAILYLASDEAGWVTGITVPVDGGLVAGK